MKVVGEAPLPAPPSVCMVDRGNCLSLPLLSAGALAGDWFFADLPNHGRRVHEDFGPAACIERLGRFAATLDGPCAWSGSLGTSSYWASAHLPGSRLRQRFRCARSSGHHRASAQTRHRARRFRNAWRRHRRSVERPVITLNRIYIETLDYWMRDNLVLRSTEIRPCPSPPSRRQRRYLKHWLYPSYPPRWYMRSGTLATRRYRCC